MAGRVRSCENTPVASAHLDSAEQVFAARETSHEKEGVEPLIDLLRLSFDQVQDLDRGKEAVLCRKYSSWERSTEAEKGRGGRARRRRIPYGRERTSLTTGSKTSRLRRLPGIVTSPFTSPTAGSSGSSTLKHVK